MIDQLKVLPGHNAKLMSLFDVIDEVKFYAVHNFITAIPEKASS